MHLFKVQKATSKVIQKKSHEKFMDYYEIKISLINDRTSKNGIIYYDPENVLTWHGFSIQSRR